MCTRYNNKQEDDRLLPVEPIRVYKCSIRTKSTVRNLFVSPFCLVMILIVWGLLLAACSESLTTGQTGSPRDKEPLPGQTIPRDDPSPLGFTPQNAIDLAIGKHTSKLTWTDGSVTELELQVYDFDNSARYVESEPPCLFDVCERVEVSVQFTIRTDDGHLYSKGLEPGLLVASDPDKVHLYAEMLAFQYEEFALPPGSKRDQTLLVVSVEFTQLANHGVVVVRPNSEDEQPDASIDEPAGEW